MRSGLRALCRLCSSLTPLQCRPRHVSLSITTTQRAGRCSGPELSAAGHALKYKRTWVNITRSGRFTVATRAQVAEAAPRHSMADLGQVSLRDVEEHLGPLSTENTVPNALPVVVVISGPSGVGKDAVITALQAARPQLHFVVTATSRAKRKGEVHGKDYIFVTKEEFEGWIRDEQLLEHAVVYGDYKGIPKQQVTGALDSGMDVVMRVDVQGAATIRRLLPHSISIFLVAESERALVQRLTQRKTEPLDSMLVRVQTAREEVMHVAAFDYVVVNKAGELQTTVDDIGAIIDAEKAAVRRRIAPAALG